MPEDKCKKAVEAASEIITEEACEDGEFVKVNVGDEGMLMWVPEGALDHSPHSPENEKREKKLLKHAWGRHGLGNGKKRLRVPMFRKKLLRGLAGSCAPAYTIKDFQRFL